MDEKKAKVSYDEDGLEKADIDEMHSKELILIWRVFSFIRLLMLLSTPCGTASSATEDDYFENKSDM